ncbi:MAG: hypothetical protein V3U69_00795, partial [Bacteroidota bacterium]
PLAREFGAINRKGTADSPWPNAASGTIDNRIMDTNPQAQANWFFVRWNITANLRSLNCD